MKIKDMKKEDLEVLSYTDLTEMILKENKKSMNTASIFREICSLLELDDSEYSNKIGDYYTSLTTDKRFILLDNAEWDLRDKHKINIVIDEDEDEDEEFEEDDETLESDNSEDESVEITDDEVDLDDEDDLDDLSIVGEEEIDEEI